MQIKMESLNDCFENIFLLFQECLEFLQQNGWSERVIGTNVKDMFSKTAHIESVCAFMNGSGLTEDFNNKLRDFWLILGKDSSPDLAYFENATDLALKKYITYEKFDSKEVKLSIDLYLKNNNKDKLVLVVKDLIRSHQMFSTLSTIVMKNKSVLEIESRIIFENWKSILTLNCESYDVIHDNVSKLINDDVSNVKLLFKILCFENKSDHSILVKNIVLANVIVSLENGFVKELWILFLNIEEDDFKYLLKAYKELLKTIYKVVEISAQNLNISYSADNYVWIENQCNTSLSYADVLVLLQKVKYVGDEIGKDLNEYLLRMKSTELCVFYEDMLRDLA